MNGERERGNKAGKEIGKGSLKKKEKEGGRGGSE